MNIAQKVESILKHDKGSRNSDKRLLIIFLQKAGMELTDKQIELFKKMPSTETIRRTRQQLQEQGKYPADEAVDQERYEKFKQVRQEINIADPEQLLEQQGYKIKEWGEY